MAGGLYYTPPPSVSVFVRRESATPPVENGRAEGCVFDGLTDGTRPLFFLAPNATCIRRHGIEKRGIQHVSPPVDTSKRTRRAEAGLVQAAVNWRPIGDGRKRLRPSPSRENFRCSKRCDTSAPAENSASVGPRLRFWVLRRPSPSARTSLPADAGFSGPVVAKAQICITVHAQAQQICPVSEVSRQFVWI
jgi:hypothetical protein